MINFFFNGTPESSARARVTKFGTFIPKKTRSWMTYVKAVAKQWRPPEPFDQPLIVILIFHLSRPKSAKKNVTHCIGRKDVDNLAKAVLDALKGDFYKDDNRIIYLGTLKRYAIKTGVTVGIYPITHDDDAELSIVKATQSAMLISKKMDHLDKTGDVLI